MQKIQETPVWQLYEKGRNYHRRVGIYADTDRNYRMYNGDQWGGVRVSQVEPVQKNFIKPIVKFKLSVIHDNLYAIVHQPPQSAGQDVARLCQLLDSNAAACWEQDKLDYKGRRITKDAAINDEGLLYVDFNWDTGRFSNEVIKKNDVYYGNENDDDLQAQPYILIRKRLPVSAARLIARDLGLGASQQAMILADGDCHDQSGDSAKQELEDMVTLVWKFYRLDGTVRFTVASRWVELCRDRNTGLELYPLAHFLWEEKEGSARGEGEVRWLIPNQMEVNRTEVRRVQTVRRQAYPQRIVDTARIANPEDLDDLGATIKTNGTPVEDVGRILGTLPPAMMSPDVVRMQEDLIRYSRDLAGAGDSATGQIDPESASGRAILAVQQASQSPMTEQKLAYKTFLEDVARIWLDYLAAWAGNGRVLTDGSGWTMEVSARLLRALAVALRIEVTPKSVYDRFAQEQTMERLLLQGFFSPQRVGELQTYVQLLDADAVAPKQKLQRAVEQILDRQRAIAQLEAQAEGLKRQAGKILGAQTGGEA